MTQCFLFVPYSIRLTILTHSPAVAFYSHLPVPLWDPARSGRVISLVAWTGLRNLHCWLRKQEGRLATVILNEGSSSNVGEVVLEALRGLARRGSVGSLNGPVH